MKLKLVFLQFEIVKKDVLNNIVSSKTSYFKFFPLNYLSKYQIVYILLLLFIVFDRLILFACKVANRQIYVISAFRMFKRFKFAPKKELIYFQS